MSELQLGQIVRSKAGRDKNRFLIVVDTITEEPEYVILSDGDLRRINNPKRKNVKHIAKTNHIDHLLAEKLKNGQAIQNIEIKKSINSFNNFKKEEEID